MAQDLLNHNGVVQQRDQLHLRSAVRTDERVALLADIMPRQLSFKHTLQLWVAWRYIGIEYYDNKQIATLFSLIAQQRVGKRPGRIEPRAVKQRPKPFPLLTIPRHRAQENVRKQGHPKKT